MEQTNKTNDIFIEDGSKTYAIRNKQGKALAEFTFRPSDTNIITRYEEVKEFFNKLDEVDEKADIKEYEQRFIEQMDYLVGTETGNTFFSIMGPFSPMPDGTLFCEICLNAVVDVINSEMDTRLEKTKSHMNKYLQKYQTYPQKSYTKKRNRRR